MAKKASKKTAKKKAKKTVAKRPVRKAVKASRNSTAPARKSPASPPRAPDPDPPKPLPKTKLTAEELAEFRRLLLEKRSELVGDVRTMTNEALRDNPPGGSGNLSSVPIHMADMGSDNWEQEFTLGLLATERQLLREIDAALGRIDAKTYGICEATHKPIGKRRLRARPWARHCIEYARQQEMKRTR